MFKIILGLAAGFVSLVVGFMLMFTASELVSVQWGIGLLLVAEAPRFLEDRK